MTSRPPTCDCDFDPHDASYLEDPAALHAQLRREAPISWNPSLGMWLVTRYDDIRAVLRDPARFSSLEAIPSVNQPTPEAQAILAQGYPNSGVLLCSDPPQHTRLRRLLSRGFSQARIQAQEPRIRQIAETLLESFITDGRADLVEQFTLPLPVLVILSLIGVPQEDMARVKRWCTDWFTFLLSPVPAERQPELARSIVAYQRYCADMIEQRRRKPQEDLTSDLMALDVEGDSLSMAELITNIGGSLAAAGHETTVAMISNCLKNLLDKPERWEMLRRDRALLGGAIEETLRLDPITPGLIRTATERAELSGVSIPRGARILLLHGSGNRDEARFIDPDQFDMHRDPQQHLSFGHGIHYCLGASLARLEARVALDVLLDRLPDLRLVPDQSAGGTLDLVIQDVKPLWAEWNPPHPA